MISVLAVCSNKQEYEALRQQFADSVALMSDDRLDMRLIVPAGQNPESLVPDDRFELAVVDVTNPGCIGLATKLRERQSELILLIIADSSISPMSYVTPEIRAESLLLKPWEKETLENIVGGIMQMHFSRLDAGGDEETFCVENTDGKTLIPYSDIYYFEARNKRVYVRTEREEYGMYGTLESVMRDMPDYFFQCHRSYVVNLKYLLKVKVSENIIHLQNGIIVPLSRTYKSRIREIINESRKR